MSDCKSSYPFQSLHCPSIILTAATVSDQMATMQRGSKRRNDNEEEVPASKRLATDQKTSSMQDGAERTSGAVRTAESAAMLSSNEASKTHGVREMEPWMDEMEPWTGEMEPWMDENFIKQIYQTGLCIDTADHGGEAG